MAEVDLKIREPGANEVEPRPEIPTELNLLPLSNSVIYPMLIAPLSVGRSSSVQLIDESIVGSNRVIGVVAQRDPDVETPGAEDIFKYGCAVIVRTLVKMPEGVRLIVQGVSRIKIVEVLQTEPYIRAKIETIEDLPPKDENSEELEALRRRVSTLFERCVTLSPQLPDELRSLTQAVQEPNVMADLIAAHMTFALEDKQQVLETVDVTERLRLMVELLGREMRVLELSSKVQSEVNTELSKSQRDYYLREQLKAIQKELGESDDREQELDELREAIDKAGLMEEALREVNREYDRLRRMSPGAPEYTVARTYIDWVISLPWETESVDNLDLEKVKRVLDKDH
jgi:ATP-dependent Lon protease